jgi:hypothetical protein
MPRIRIAILTLTAALAISAASPANAQTPAAPAPSAAPTTNVLATLTINPATPRPELMKVLPDEVRATVRLYLDGKIAQWYARGDGKGVIFVLNAASVDEARKMVADLPFEKAGMATFDYMALTPLSPLRVLLTQ